MKTLTSLLCAFLFVGGATFAMQSKASHDDDLKPFYEKDSSLKAFLGKSYAYIVYPKISKGGFGIGGAGGKGNVYQGGKLVGTSKLKQVMVGPLIGGQSYGQIVAFESAKAFQKFKDGKLQFSAQISSVALENGRAIKTSFNDGVAIFIANQKGLMAEVSVSGQKLTFEPIK